MTKLSVPQFGEDKPKTIREWQDITGAAKLIGDTFDAVEVEMPEEWSAGAEDRFAIFVSGVARPDWSRREALQLAQAGLALRARLESWNKRAKEATGKQAVSVPKFFSVVRCPVCNELQLGASRASRQADECQVCSVNCEKRDGHRSNQINCDHCRSEMETIWTTEDDIPNDWRL